MALDNQDVDWLRDMMDQLEDLSAGLELGVDDLISKDKIDQDQRDVFKSIIDSLYDANQNLDEILNRQTRW